MLGWMKFSLGRSVPSWDAGCAAMAQTAPPRASTRCFGFLPAMSHSVKEPSRPPLKSRQACEPSSCSQTRLVTARSLEPASVCRTGMAH